MKRLILVRHAKSSWSFDCRDHDRPLGKRGRKDVLKMGKYAKKRISCPELIITSSASRALYTALHLADHWGYPEEKIITSNKLYHSTPLEIGEILSELGQIDSVALFGHNPGFTDFQNSVSDTIIENIPTGGIIGLDFDMDTWKEIMVTTAKQAFFYTPKGI